MAPPIIVYFFKNNFRKKRHVMSINTQEKSVTYTMQSDLLKKEDEFYKENEKLEQRTKELMRKVNDVMKIQDNLIKEALNTNLELNVTKNSSTSADRLSDNLNLDCFKSDSNYKNDDPNIPSSVNDMGKKGFIHFYKAKMKSLQEENLSLHHENKKKGEEIKKLQKENLNISEEKQKWFASYNTAKNTIGKLESQVSSLSSKLQSKDSEVASIKKESEQIKKELKSSNLNVNNYEVRLNRAYEENEKLKATIKSSKEEEKELKEVYKKQINDLTVAVKRIEHQKAELLNGFKKQVQLIDLLKRQKMYLEAYKITELSEAEYLKILDWKLA
ncbi:hypothetical protein NQ315_009734 [Exocentrus adspersus]|uniref:Testis-expressed protein 9 n=1 Tax=Exocentrus adspersus TaxID=1586481 RepID=A0AAV8WI13_9CUCU|nr:hypothetical protein NQ315_009734 [Exocentrus adspersus]